MRNGALTLVVVLLVGVFGVALSSLLGDTEATALPAGKHASAPVVVPGGGVPVERAAAPSAPPGEEPLQVAAPDDAPVVSSAPASLPPPAPEPLAAPAPVHEPLATVVAAEPGPPFLAGVVLRADGAPLASATVTLLGEGVWLRRVPERMRAFTRAQMRRSGQSELVYLQPVATTATDPAGAFRFAGPGDDDADSLWLRVEHRDGLPVLSASFERGAPPGPIHVTLPAGGTVTVTVRAVDGAPIDGPWAYPVPGEEGGDDFGPVVASPLAFHVALAVPASGADDAGADADGADTDGAAGSQAARGNPIVLTAVPPGRRVVRAGARGFRFGDATVDLAPGGHAAVEVSLERGLTIRGVVVDGDGAPIAGANVWTWSMAGQGAGGTSNATTGGDGTFEVVGLLPGSYAVMAQAEGFGGSFRPGAMPDTHEAGSPEPVRIVLGRQLGLSGRVVRDEDGRPVEGATVSARDVAQPMMPTGGEGATTDAEGRFTLASLAPGRYELRARGPEGLLTFDALAVRVRGGEEVTGVELRLRRGLVVRVEVVDAATGRPVEGATVQARTQDEAAMAMWAMWAQDGGQGPAAPVTDARGAAEVTVPPGSYLVGVEHDAYAPGSVPVVVGSGRGPGPADVRVELAGPGTLRGRILEADGTPLATTPLMVMGQSAGGDPHMSMSATDEAGAFELTRLAAGTYRLQLMPTDGGGGGWRLLTEATLQPGETREVEVRLASEANLGRVSGRVVRGGEGLVGVPIVLVPRGGDALESRWAVTEEGGSFSADALEPGTYAVSAAGAREVSLDVAAGATVEVTLQVSAGVIAGRVSGVDAAALEEVHVVLVRVPGAADDPQALSRFVGGLEHGTLDEHGRFTYERVGPGRYRVAVLSPDGAGLSDEVALAEGGAQAGLEVVLGAAPALAVRVSLDDGTPLAGAKIGLYHEGLQVSLDALLMQGGLSAARTSDAQGTAPSGPIPPGRYVVYAAVPGRAPAVAQGVVVGETPAEVALVLGPGGALEVHGPPGVEVDVRLAASGAPAESFSMLDWLGGQARTGEDGVAVVRDLPPLAVTVRGQHEGRTLGPVEVTVVAGTTAQVELR